MLRLVIVTLLNLLRALYAPVIYARRSRAAPRGGVVQLELGGALAEVPRLPGRSWLPRALRPKRDTALSRVRELCEAIAVDERPKGLFITLKPIDAGWAKAAALRQALGALTGSGKQVHVFMPQGGGLKELFVASAASTRSAPPHAAFFLVGLGGRALYLGGALKRLGVRMDVTQRHEFKSAGETFARETMSDAARAQTELLVSGLQAQVETQLAGTLNVPGEALSRGPYRAEQAKALGLITHAAHEDELPKLLDADDGDGALLGRGAADYLGRRTRRAFLPWRRRPVIAVVPFVGNIVDDGKRPGTIATEMVRDAADALGDDPRVAACVLVIDSRGGSAHASADMFRAVRRLAEKKPVIAYLSDYAASGGYYLACAATHIVANPLTVTGSIGVISMRPVLDALLDKLAIARDGVVKGAHSGLLDMTAEWSEAEQAALAGLIDETYAEFTGVVAAARKLSAEAVDALARGRVWLGEDAARRGLVDQLGTLEDAVAAARKAALDKHPKLARSLAVKPVIWDPAPQQFWAGLPPFAQVFASAVASFEQDNPLSRLWAYEPLKVD